MDGWIQYVKKGGVWLVNAVPGSKFVKYGAAAAVGAVVLPFVAVPAIHLVGFGAAGVVKGGIAAGVQAGMGGIILKGCPFALLQAAGAAGHIAGANAAILAVVGGAAGAGILHVLPTKVNL